MSENKNEPKNCFHDFAPNLGKYVAKIASKFYALNMKITSLTERKRAKY